MRFFTLTSLTLLVTCPQLLAEVRIVRDSANELTSVSYSDVERTPEACFDVTYLNNGLAAGGHRLSVSLGDVESDLFGGQFATVGSHQQVCTRLNAADLDVRLQRFSTPDSQTAVSSINATEYHDALILAHGDNLAEKLAEFGFAGGQDATMSLLDSLGYLSVGMVASGNGRFLVLFGDSQSEVSVVEMSYVDQSTILDNRFYYGGSNIYRHPDTVIAGLGVETMSVNKPNPGAPGMVVSFDGTTRPVELHTISAAIPWTGVFQYRFNEFNVATLLYTLEDYSPDADSSNDAGHVMDSLGQRPYNIPPEGYVTVGNVTVPSDDYLATTCHVEGEEDEIKGYESKIEFGRFYPNAILPGDYVFEFGKANSSDVGQLFICKALNENASVQAPRAVYRADEGINQFEQTVPAIPRTYAWPHLIDEAHWAAALVLSRETTLPARSPLLCDLNQDGRCSADDVNLIASSNIANEYDQSLDLNADNLVNGLDSELWISDSAYMNSYIGDSNLDGVFDSADLVLVFAAAQYEDGILLNSGWAEGDWNSDGEFDSGDLIAAFSQGGYDQGPRSAAHVVPEPTGLSFVLVALLYLIPQRLKQARGAQVHSGS